MNRVAETESDCEAREDRKQPIDNARGRVGELENTVARLQELQDGLEDLLLSVSHDLRNPLTVIIGHAQLLQRLHARAGISDQGRSLETIIAVAQRMNMMIQDILDCARSQSGRLQCRPRSIDLSQFLHALLVRLAVSLDIGRVQVTVEPGTPEVMADPDHLERIVVNLLSNALKYSGAGSPVELRARGRGREALVEVRDRGQGFSAEDLPHVFDRFGRVGATTGGDSIGLGLYITKMLVEAQGGWIGVVSEPGRGTTFTFTLPVAGI